MSAADLAIPVAIGVPAAGLWGYTKWHEAHTPKPVRSLARPRDVAPLTPRGVHKSAQQLRDGLGHRPAPEDCGVLLGQLSPGSTVLRAGWRSTILAIMGPGAGKTTALAVNAILDAPGPTLATSNKPDLCFPWRPTMIQTEHDSDRAEQVRDQASEQPGAVVHRLRRKGRRERAHPRFLQDEWDDVADAARRAGLTVSGWAAAAAVAAARGEPPPRVRIHESRLRELAETRAQLVRIGTLLNQAVAKFNATGEVPSGLPYLAGRVSMLISELDGLTAALVSRRDR